MPTRSRPLRWTLLAALLAVGAGIGLPDGRAGAAAALMPGPALQPLPFYYDIYTFRGAADRGGRRQTAVVAAFAVPAGRLEREVRGGEVRYRFDVTLVVADTARRVVYRTDDSVYVSLNRGLAGDHLLFTHVQVAAPPSTTTVQRVIMTDATTPGIGQLYSSHFPVPDYSGTRLMLSDLALGTVASSGGFRRGDISMALLPSSQFPESAFDVYYEVYNLPDGHAYTTTVTVEGIDPVSGGVRPGTAVSVRYTGVAEAGAEAMVQELRRVDASVGRGDFRITVAVTDDVTGRTARRSRPFRVSGWAPGATLVTALPWKTDGPPAAPRPD
jgi:hypothetical protein